MNLSLKLFFYYLSLKCFQILPRSSPHEREFLYFGILFNFLFSWEKGGNCYLLLCYPVRRVKKTLVITFVKNWNLVFLHNLNRSATNETEPFSFITSTSEEQNKLEKQRTSSYLVQIHALNPTKFRRNSLLSASIMGLLHTPMGDGCQKS